MSRQTYLPHIDGLRALSVILVILFHFNVGVFTGGYIGVDVFFTISGYLIIGSIVSQLGQGKFSPLDFWQRRIRRLVPAILATLALCFIAGFIIMSPANFEHLARQSFFALFSIINFTLLGKGDYFDQSSLDESLVHFWSLSVEEQFYLAFPLLALLVFSFVKKKENFKKVIGVLLFILSVISLIAAEYMIRTGFKSAAYYMMPTRFSQLALGGLLAIYLQSPQSEKFTKGVPETAQALITAMGLILIICVSIFFTANTPFPGFNSLWPTLGALAVLASGGRSGSLIKNILENKLSSYLGKLSYSLYLVHWPVWVFLCYYVNHFYDGLSVLIPVFVTIGLSALIYHFVETPIRFSKRFEGKLMYRAILPSLIGFCLVAGVIFSQQGLKFRIDEKGQKFIKDYPDTANYHRLHFGGNGYGAGVVNTLGNPNAKPEFLIIGDSKARQLATGLDEYLKSARRQVVMINFDGCPFVTDALMYTNGVPHEKCIAASAFAKSYAAENKIPILSIRSWIFYQSFLRDLDGQRYKGKKSQRAKKFADIFINYHTDLSANQTPILMVGDNSMFKNVKPISDCQSRPSWVRDICLKVKDFPMTDFEMPKIEEQIKAKTQSLKTVTYVPMAQIFCPDGVCSQIDEAGDILYSDPYHLSKKGSHHIAPILLSTAREAFGLPDYVVQEILDPCDVQTPNVKRQSLKPPFAKNGEVGWHIALPDISDQASNNDHPNRSQYILCENGAQLGSSNALHANIRDIGKGDYSHWGQYLIFSTSDNSDPNGNNKHYEFVLLTE